MKIDKYLVQLYESGSEILIKSNTIIASSKEEAIEKSRHDKWWYDEGTGLNHKPLKYPLTFVAKNILE